MTDVLDGKRLAVLGAGKIGSLLARSFLEQKLIIPERLRATVRQPERARVLAQDLRVDVSTDNRAAASEADVVLLCVKPQSVAGVLEAIRSELGPEKLVISVAASVPTHYIEQRLGADVPVVRAMPNTPCAVGSGMTGLCAGRFAGPGHLETARALFEAVGRTVVVDEKLMDAVTGLSASGPAFLYVVLESLVRRADHARRRPHGARDRRAPRPAQGRRDDARRVHHRRHPRARRGRAARDAHQGGGQSHGAGGAAPGIGGKGGTGGKDGTVCTIAVFAALAAPPEWGVDSLAAARVP